MGTSFDRAALGLFSTLAASLPTVGCDRSPAPDLTGPAPIFVEHFEAPLDAAWEWRNEDDTTWRLDDGTLLLRTGEGGMFRDDRRERNLLLRGVPEHLDAWCVEVDLSSVPTQLYENAGLIVFHDEDNYTVLTKEAFPERRDPPLILRVFAEIEQKIADDSETSYSQSPFVRLRLQISGDRVTGSFQESGASDWIEVGAAPIPTAEPRYVGVQTSYGSEAREDWVSFDAFRLSADCEE